MSSLPECTCEQAVALCRRHGLERDLSPPTKAKRRAPRRSLRGKSLKQELSDAKWVGIKDVLLEIDPRCAECGIKGDGSTLDADHIVPRSQGGPSRASNAQLLCRECHAKKHGVPKWGSR